MKKNELKPRMNRDEHRFQTGNLKFICVYLCLSVIPFYICGCTSRPNQANIELRKQIQSMQGQMAELQRQHDADLATMRAHDRQPGATTATLSADQLARLYTTAGLSIGRLSGGADLDAAKPGDDGVTVYVAPIDQEGDSLKAAGSFSVELFDLNEPNNNLVGKWDFDLDQARKNWRSLGLLYEYVFNCPWQQPPKHSELTLKVTFRDELTQREFSSQKIITVKLK